MFDALRRGWHLRDIERRVALYGWTVIYVDGDEQSPTWAYSIGPPVGGQGGEIVMFDGGRDDVATVFEKAREEICSGQLVLEDGRPWLEDLGGRAVWRRVHPSQLASPDQWFAAAQALAARRGVVGRVSEMFQLVLPDGELRLPWEPGYDEALRARQPALWLPAVSATWTSPLARQALRLVAERGWHVVPIEGGPQEWAYTIGLPDSLGSPELITFGPARGVARMLETARTHIVDGRLRVADGLAWDGLGFPTCWRRVHESQVMGFQWLLLAKAHAEALAGERLTVEAYQMFAPDAAGRYPWDPGYDRRLRKLQPLLYEPLDLARKAGG